MNDTEFDTLARTSAATIRAEAERIADSDSALRALLGNADAAVAEPGGSDAEIIDLDDVTPIRRRPLWLPVTAAAAVIATIAGVAFLANSADDDPAVTTDPVTVPVTAAVIVPQPAPDPVTTEPTDTDEATSVQTTEPIDNGAAVDATGEVIDVPDERGPQLERTVLATYETGSGDGALGFEQCQECEPFRPWAPIVTDDGTIFVADGLNGRWMIFRDVAWSSSPYRDGEVVTAAPVVGPDGLIYAMVANSLTQTAPRHIVGYDPVDLTEVVSYAQGSSSGLPLDLIDGNVTYSSGASQAAVTEFERPASSASATVIWSAEQVEMSSGGITRRFQFPDDWSLEAPATYSAPDGSVVVTARAPATDGSMETVLTRLRVDGTASIGFVSSNGSSANDGTTRFSSEGLIRLEDGEIVRYAWPDFIGPDPLAGWALPEFSAPDLDAVPYFIPAEPVPGVVQTDRSEYADQPSERLRFVQTFALANVTGAVAAIVQYDTSFDPNLVTAVDTQVDVAGWEMAYYNASSPDVDILRLHTATRSMLVWTSGLSQDVTTELARSLTVDSDGVGWQAPGTNADDRWTLIAEGWTSGAALRSIRQTTPDGRMLLELNTGSGLPDMIGNAGLISLPETPITLTDVDGHPALLIDRGVNRAVTWQPEPGIVVLLGFDGSTDDALAAARSVIDVDRATWLASAIEQPGGGDGCNSMFC